MTDYFSTHERLPEDNQTVNIIPYSESSLKNREPYKKAKFFYDESGRATFRHGFSCFYKDEIELWQFCDEKKNTIPILLIIIIIVVISSILFWHLS